MVLYILKKPWFYKVWAALGSLPVWGGGGGIPRKLYSPSLLSHLEGEDFACLIMCLFEIVLS